MNEWRLLGKSMSDIDGGHSTWHATVWTNQLIWFSSVSTGRSGYGSVKTSDKMVWFDLSCCSMNRITKKTYVTTSDKRETDKESGWRCGQLSSPPFPHRFLLALSLTAIGVQANDKVVCEYSNYQVEMHAETERNICPAEGTENSG